jgi:hypothetical protein
MKKTLSIVSLLIGLIALIPSSLMGSVITIVATDVQNLSTYTTPDELLTLTPQLGGDSSGQLFSNHGSLIGVQGGNDNAFSMLDWRGANETSQGMELQFGVDAGLSSIVFQWYSADVQISGFSSDPMASGFDSAEGNSLRNIEYDNGTLTFRAEGNWGGSATLELADLSASANSTLSFSLLDHPDYSTAVASSITAISYEVIPEPSAYALIIGIVAFAVLLRRRNR